MMVAFLGSMQPIFSHQSGDILVLQNKKNLHKIVEIFSFKIIKNATRVAVFYANWCQFTTYLVCVPFRLLRTCVAKRIQTQSATNLQKTQRSRSWLPIRTSLLHCKSKA